MRAADQIDAIVRRSVYDADSASAVFRERLREVRGAPESAGKSERQPDRDEFLAQAERDGAVTPRVLLPADYADSAPQLPQAVGTPEQDRSEPAPIPPVADAAPDFDTGWLSDQ